MKEIEACITKGFISFMKNERNRSVIILKNHYGIDKTPQLSSLELVNKLTPVVSTKRIIPLIQYSISELLKEIELKPQEIKNDFFNKIFFGQFDFYPSLAQYFPSEDVFHKFMTDLCHLNKMDIKKHIRFSKKYNTLKKENVIDTLLATSKKV